MTIEVEWKALKEEDPRWNYSRCLYAYLAPNGNEILYIGKAWGTSVRNRRSWSSKKEFWKDLKKQRGIKHHVPLIGQIYLRKGVRLTRQLLADVESLLIQIEKPWGNIQSRDTRIRRPGMQVKCAGEWPSRRKIYRDKWSTNIAYRPARKVIEFMDLFKSRFHRHWEYV